MAQPRLNARLSSLDAAFLNFEKKEAPMHIGSVSISYVYIHRFLSQRLQARVAPVMARSVHRAGLAGASCVTCILWAGRAARRRLSGTHVGLAFNPWVYEVIANRLPQAGRASWLT